MHRCGPFRLDSTVNASRLLLPCELRKDPDGGAGSDGTRKNWRRDLVEGLARAATQFPSEQASAAGLRMAGPIVDTLDRLAKGASGYYLWPPFIALGHPTFADCPSGCPPKCKHLHMPAFLLSLHRLCPLFCLRLVNEEVYSCCSWAIGQGEARCCGAAGVSGLLVTVP